MKKKNTRSKKKQVLLSKYTPKKKKDIAWVRINTSIPVGKKPIDQRLGRGKAKVNTLISRVPAGRVLVETSSKSRKKAIVMLLAVSKMLNIPSYIRVS